MRFFSLCGIYGIRFYQKFLSVFLGRSCRYYPTCSNYALWLFECDKPHLALYKGTLRILSCNPLFSGGISYPKMSIAPTPPILLRHKAKYHKILYWLIPYTKQRKLDTISHQKIICLIIKRK